MKITFEEVLSEKDWLTKELLNSLPSDIVKDSIEKRYYDVKLNINGIDVEPHLFNYIMNNIEKVVEDRAKEMILDKFDVVESKLSNLSHLFDLVRGKIAEDFNIKNEDY